MISFKVDITPVPKGRPRFWNGHAVSDPKTRKFEREFRLAAKSHAPASPFAGPLHLTAIFNLLKPKRPSKNYPSRGDLDNLLKSVSDSLNGLFWKDDTQLVSIDAAKKYADGQPWIYVSIQEVA